MKTIFEKIYIISLISNKERQEFIRHQFNELGLDFEFIYGIDFINFKNIKFPNLFNNPPDRPQDFGCAITHYAAISQAYHLGYNNVLIIEDDVCLTKDNELIHYMLNNIPDDADFVTYDYRNSEIDEYNIINNININNSLDYIKLECNHGFYGAAMFGIMNRQTMELYIKNQQHYINVADNILGIFNNSNLNRYVSTKCLFIDQLTYKKRFINHDYSLLEYYDNLYLRMNKEKYDETYFFKPPVFNEISREHV